MVQDNSPPYNSQRTEESNFHRLGMLSSQIKQTVVQGHTFSIDGRYKPRNILGRGSFGVVCTAFDSATGNKEDLALPKTKQ